MYGNLKSTVDDLVLIIQEIMETWTVLYTI